MENEYPECPICLDIFGINQEHIRAPKVLSCGDSICKECLESVIKKSTEEFFLCPLCKSQIKKNEDINDYITNKELIRLVNSFFNLPKTEVENKIDNKEGNKEEPISYRIISLGNSGVGKSSVFTRIVTEQFDNNITPTVSCDIFKPYYIKYKKQKYKLFFYDTAGLEKNFNTIPKNYLRQSDGVFFIYDVTEKNSFYNLDFWLQEYSAQKKKVIGVIIGNKCDLKRQVKYEEAKSYADKHGLNYFEVSAKLDKNVKKAVICLLENIVESNALYNSVDSIDQNDMFQLDPKKLREESFCSKFCKKLNPKKWFSKE